MIQVHPTRIVGLQQPHPWSVPFSEDGRMLDVTNVIWCTGYRPDYSWISVPIFERKDVPAHNRGVVEDQPGLCSMGLNFQYSASSSQVNGLGRDSAYIAKAMVVRMAHRTESGVRV